MPYYFLDKEREKDPRALGEVEIFYGKPEFVTDTPGWCYAYGFPGCLWDSDPVGPFETEAEALKAAREAAGYCEHGIAEDEICEECPAPELWALKAGDRGAYLVFTTTLEATKASCWLKESFAREQAKKLGMVEYGYQPVKLSDADARRWGRSD